MDEQGGLIHELEQRIRFHDCGPGLQLSVPAALRYFEEIALLQSDALGYGFAYYHEQKVGWLLSRWNLSFSRLPAFDETVTVRTQPRECGSLAANRAFELVSADGRTRIEGMCQWIFVNMERQRPTRIPRDLALAYGMTPQKGQPPIGGDVAAPDREDAACDIEVRGTDIDLNGHVNNVCYVEWALHSLPAQVHGLDLVKLSAHFQKETLLGARVRVTAEVEEKGGSTVVRHAVREGDRTACLLTTEWVAP